MALEGKRRIRKRGKIHMISVELLTKVVKDTDTRNTQEKKERKTR